MRLLQLLLDYASVVALAASYAAALAVCGGFLERRFKQSGGMTGDSRWVRLAASMVLGQAVVGTLWQTIAAFGAFRWPVVAPFLAFCLVAGALRHARAIGGKSPVPTRPIQTDFATAILAALCVGVAAMFAPLSLLPPGTDAMAFYMAQPKLIASTHALTPLAGYEYFSTIGLSSEMHYAAFFLLGGDHVGSIAGKLFIWINGAALLALVWGISQRAGLDAYGRWIATVIVLCSSAFTLILWDGKTDLLPAAVGLLAIYWLLPQPPEAGRIALAGLATGLACASKLSFIPSLGVGIALLVLRQAGAEGSSYRHKISRILRTSAILGAAAAVPFLLLALKNGIVFGEPFSPFFLLGGGKGFPLDQVWFDEKNTRWIVATYPLALMLGQYPMQHGNLSALVLVALPLLAVTALRRFAGATAVWLALAGIAGVVTWAVLRPSVLAPRYILPSLIMIAPLAAAVLSGLARRGLLAAIVVNVTLVASLLVMFQDVRLTLRENRGYLLTLPRRYEHPIWQTADVANLSLRPDARVLNLMYYSSMYRVDLLACLIAPDPESLRAMSGTAAQFWRDVHKRGVTHISLDRLTHERLLNAPIDPSAAPDWLEVTERKINDRFRSFELKAKPGAPPVEAPCDRLKAGAALEKSS